MTTWNVAVTFAGETKTMAIDASETWQAVLAALRQAEVPPGTTELKIEVRK